MAMHKVIVMKGTLLILSLLASPILGTSSQTQIQEVDVKIFQVPAVQIIVKNEPLPHAEEGVVTGIRGTQTGGYVTGFFPDGIILFETDLKQTHGDIIKSIRERAMSSRPDWVNILQVADVQVRFNRDSLDGGVMGGRNFRQRHKHLEIDYDFKARPLLVTDEEIVIKVVFSLRGSSEEDKVLLDQTIALKADKTLVVGFPTNDDSGRGTLFWLAFSINE